MANPRPHAALLLPQFAAAPTRLLDTHDISPCWCEWKPRSLMGSARFQQVVPSRLASGKWRAVGVSPLRMHGSLLHHCRQQPVNILTGGISVFERPEQSVHEQLAKRRVVKVFDVTQ